MRRRSPGESSIYSTAVDILNPRLRATLDSLDVELEAELARYRRQRDRQPDNKERKRFWARDRRHAAASLPIEASAAPLAAALPSPPVETPLPPAALAPTLTEQAPPMVVDPGASSLATLNPDSAESLTRQAERQADDYFESSEELLRSLTEDEAELRAEQEPGILESLLTPLGIGSMLLLLLSSTTLGYLIMNPGSLGLLRFDSSAANPSATATVATASPDASAPSASLPISPNLASQEFQELDVDTLPTLSPGQRLSPTPAAQPSVAESPANSATPSREGILQQTFNTRRSSRPESASSPRSAAPRGAATAPPSTPVQSTAARANQPAPVASPQPAPATATATAPSPAASRNGLYRVYVPYRSDRDLDLVDGAFLSNSQGQAVVQLGAFSSSESAEGLVNELRQQGVSAQIVQP